MKAKKSVERIMVKAPDGYHWMNKGGRFFLMPHEGKFVPHENASLEMPFRVMKTHQ